MIYKTGRKLIQIAAGRGIINRVFENNYDKWLQ
jgi:hypothetical protein